MTGFIGTGIQLIWVNEVDAFMGEAGFREPQTWGAQIFSS
jgi:hypothetical protein